MKIECVTFTGADDRTSIVDLIKCNNDYRRLAIEWGVLLSKSSEGSPRFPKLGWLQSLHKQSAAPAWERWLGCSGHLCGKYVREMVAGEFTFQRTHVDVMKLFQRFQINFHGESHGPHAPMLQSLASCATGQSFIFQMDGVNDSRFWDALAGGYSVTSLFDRSHGAGVVPNAWPAPSPGIFSGYAGGLGPDNLADELKRIEDVVGDRVIWIDMETKVRDDQDRFDLTKVARCMEIATPYLTP